VNANRKPLSELYRCMDWNPVASIDPRWREPELEDQDATKLKGQVAPDFELTTLDGEKFCLSDHLGKVVVLDFWATWCRPCVLGMPDNRKVVRAYSEGEVVFAAINFTETSSTLKDFNKTMRWDARILLDPSADVASKYNVTALPHLVVIDPQGNVAEVKVGHHADTFRKSSLDNQICITK
jgi:peroxiredoxin